MKINWDKWQVEFMECKGDKILCCGRRSGKSEICAAEAGTWALNNSKKTILMIAPTERQSYWLFDKTLNYLLMVYPKAVIMKGKDRPTKERLLLTNGTQVLCLPTGQSGTGIRGLTIDRLYVDEASRVPEDVWTAITPMLLTTGGDSIYLSTPHGKQGEFWRCWSNENTAYESFTRFSVTSETVVQDRPISPTWTQRQRDRALLQLENEKKRMSKKRYAQEYLGEFVDDFFRWFSDELIQKCCTQKRRDRIYEDEQAMHFMGVDIARMGEDDIVYAIGDRRSDIVIQVENIIKRKQYTTQTEDDIRALIKKYQIRMTYIDAGSGTLGVSILDHLIKLPELKKHIKDINNAKRVVEYNNKREPVMAKLMKEDLYDNLRALMEQDRIRLLDDDEIKYSLASIQYEYDMKPGHPTKLRIWGDYSHIAEALIRLAWCVKEKVYNPKISYF